MAVSLTTALIIAATTAASASAYSASVQKTAANKSRRLQKSAMIQQGVKDKASLEQQEIARQQLEKAPQEAKDKAKADTIKRRKSLSKTVLTSSQGVETSGTVLKKTLGGK